MTEPERRRRKQPDNFKITATVGDTCSDGGSEDDLAAATSRRTVHKPHTRGQLSEGPIAALVAVRKREAIHREVPHVAKLVEHLGEIGPLVVEPEPLARGGILAAWQEQELGTAIAATEPEAAEHSALEYKRQRIVPAFTNRATGGRAGLECRNLDGAGRRCGRQYRRIGEAERQRQHRLSADHPLRHRRRQCEVEPDQRRFVGPATDHYLAEEVRVALRVAPGEHPALSRTGVVVEPKLLDQPHAAKHEPNLGRGALDPQRQRLVGLLCPVRDGIIAEFWQRQSLGGSIDSRQNAIHGAIGEPEHRLARRARIARIPDFHDTIARRGAGGRVRHRGPREGPMEPERQTDRIRLAHDRLHPCDMDAKRREPLNDPSIRIDTRESQKYCQ